MRKRITACRRIGTHQHRHPVKRSHPPSRALLTPILPQFLKRWWRSSIQRSRTVAGRSSAMFHDTPPLPLPPRISCLTFPHRCFVIATFACVRLAYLSHSPSFPVTRPRASLRCPESRDVRFLVAARSYRHGRSLHHLLTRLAMPPTYTQLLCARHSPHLSCSPFSLFYI